MCCYIEGAGPGPGSRESREMTQPLAAKGLGAVEEPEDLRLLDWSERVGAVLTTNAVGAAIWPSKAVQAGALRAAEALGGEGEGAAMAVALVPAERVALTAALACVAVDSEAMRVHLMGRLEGAISAHKMGHLPLAPKKVKPKPLLAAPAVVGAGLPGAPSTAGVGAGAGGGGEDVKETAEGAGAGAGAAAGGGDSAAALATPAPIAEKPPPPPPAAAVAPRPDWAESLIEWVAKAADRSVYLRGRAIATDETGRRYHTLGGSAGAGIVFVEEPVADEGAEGAEEVEAAAQVKKEAPGGGEEGDAMDVDGGGGGDKEQSLAAAADDAANARAAAAEASREKLAAESRAAIVRGKARAKAIAEADGFGGDFNHLVILDISNRLLQCHHPWRRQADGFVLTRGAHIGELLSLEGVDDQVVVSVMLTDNHSLVSSGPRLNKHDTTVFEVEESIGDNGTHPVGDENTIAAAFDGPFKGLVGMEDAAHDAGAAGIGEELSLVADEAAGGG